MREQSGVNAVAEYNKKFDWLTYLKEVKAEPVPFSFFTQVRSLVFFFTCVLLFLSCIFLSCVVFYVGIVIMLF